MAQTFEDLEIVIVDDASADATLDLVHAMNDRRIKYLRHDINKGVSCSRNTAITNATGEYIAFLDDDDEWLPEKLRYQLDHMQTVGRKVGAICCGHYEVDSSSKRILTEIRPALRGQIFEALLIQGFFNHTSTMLVRAECFEKVGMFDPAFCYGEDLDMWLRLAREYEFDFVPRPLVRLYFQTSGLTQNYSAIISGAETHLSKYREFFEQHPRVYSDRLHRLGTYYCLIGDLEKGREMFRGAVGKNPRSLKSYLSLALSRVGPEGFKRFFVTKDRVLRWCIRS